MTHMLARGEVLPFAGGEQCFAGVLWWGWSSVPGIAVQAADRSTEPGSFQASV
ncbi:hypothetical protein [Reticulibacter mediterranei]|uniref:hypothetical protein n=1 Tax=Reticulibacter mediterranei TaxID=2778369 RepID=UPI001C691FF9|nr:hypothetical protein [Reticulibacter mediterranei]